MVIRFDELKEGEIKLPPIEVAIEGLDDPVELQQFTWCKFEEFLNNDSESKTKDYLASQVIKLLRGFEPEPSQQEIDRLKKQFSVPIIRKIYEKGLEINGFGKAAQEKAKKN